MKKILFTVALGTAVLSAYGLHQAQADDSAASFEVYGFAMGDYIQDFDRVVPAWEDTLRPSKIATLPGQYGSNVQASVSPKQSRLGAKGNLPTEGHDLLTDIEFDFFGVGVDEGQTTIRLRHAYGAWWQWLGGQTNSLFMDGDVFPNVIDYWGPCGMVFLRTPQLRWTPISGNYSLAIAIEKPDTNIDAGNARQLDPDLGTTLQNDEKLPDLTAQLRANRPWGHIQIAGILRRLGFDTLGTADNIPKDHVIGWGFDLTSVVRVFDRDKLYLSGTYGHGIATYMNDGGVDIAPEGSPGNLQASAVPLFGVMAYYEHSWNERWTSSAGYSRTQVSNRSFQRPDAYHSGEYVSGNVLFTPVKNMLVGGEFLWGRRVDNNFNTGVDYRFQISLKYTFSSKGLYHITQNPEA